MTRNSKYTSYDRKKIEKAIIELRAGVPVCQVSKKYGIKRTTLYPYKRVLRMISTPPGKGWTEVTNYVIAKTLFESLGQICDQDLLVEQVRSEFPILSKYALDRLEKDTFKSGELVKKFKKGKEWLKDKGKMVAANASEKGEIIWFVLIHAQSHQFFETNDRVGKAPKVKRTIMNFINIESTKMFLVMKTGLSAAKIGFGLKRLSDWCGGNRLRVIILNERLEDLMSLKRIFPCATVEIPFADCTAPNALEKWNYLQKVKRKAIEKQLKTGKDPASIANQVFLSLNVILLVKKALDFQNSTQSSIDSGNRAA